MKVCDLIKSLKKMPKNAEVGFRDLDASEHEVSSWVDSVCLCSKDEMPCPDGVDKWERQRFSQLPKEWIVLYS